MEAPKYKLNEETAKLYDLAAGAPNEFYRPNVGHININTVTPEQADALIKDGCTHFTLKEKAGKAPKVAGTES